MLIAAWHGTKRTMNERKVSLTEGVNVNVADDSCCTGCQNGIWIDNLLLDDEDDNSVDESSLIAAIRNHHLECIISLLRSGADVNVMSAGGETALSIACNLKNIRAVELLLERGNKKPCTTSIISILVDQKVDTNILQLLLQHGLKYNLTEVIDLVYQHSFDNVNDIWNGSTAFLTAAVNGSVEMLNKLISHGVNMDGKNSNGEIISSPLCVSCENGHFAAVEYLLEAGAEVNIEDDKGRTPLFYAAASRSIDILKLLFKRGASVNAQDASGFNALVYGYSITNGADYLDVVNCWLQSGLPVEDIHYQNCLVMAAKNGHYEIVKTLLMFHIDPNQPSSWGNTALGNACAFNHESIVECLLMNKANPNLLMTDCGNCFTPLGRACENSHIGIVKLLLAFNADPNFCVPDCWMALHTSVRKGDVTIAKMLIEHGADVNCPQMLGFSCKKPLLYALKYYHCPKSSLENVAPIKEAVSNQLQLIKMLIDSGADLTSLCTESDSTWELEPSLLYVLEILRMDNIINYIQNSVQNLDQENGIQLCVNACAFVDARHVCFPRIVDLGFREVASTILNTRVEIVKYLIDHGLSLFPYSDRESCNDRELYRFNFKNFLIPMDNGRCSLIYLFKAGAHFKLLSWACKMLEDGNQYTKYDDRSMNFFKALVLNGLEVDERDLQYLENNTVPSCRCKMLTWYQEHKQKPLSLLQLSRINVRKWLILANNFLSILSLIDNLMLSEDLKSYLKFEGMYNEIDLSTPSDSDRVWKELLSNVRKNA